MGLIHDSLRANEEEAGTIATEIEKEVVIYARLGNPQGLEQAVRESYQEQAQIKTDEGSVRVRKTVEGGKPPVYEMTTKVRVDGENGLRNMRERTVQIPEEVFIVFKEAAPASMIKTRYYFQVEKATVTTDQGIATVALKDMFYEVDVFHKNGSASEWVKIDVEVQNLRQQLEAAGIEVANPKLRVSVSKLPFKPVAVILDDGEQDPEKQKLIREIYDTQFLTRHREKAAP